MPTIYKAKQKSQLKRSRADNIPIDVIQRALDEIKTKTKSIRQASKDYNIPKSTLFGYVKANKIPGSQMYRSKFITRQLLTDTEEKALADYLITSANMHYGLNINQTKELAYNFALANNKNVPQNWHTNKRASKDWLRGFFHRQTNLSIRKPEPTSLSRATSFNKKNVGEFFDRLQHLYEKYHFDDTGLQTVHQPSKIIAEKGKKQVGRATSGEKGETVTVCATINAIGNSIPPFFIFPRARYKDYMLKNAPIGSIGSANPSGWMNGQIFLQYLQHFSKFVSSNTDSPVLLLCDNHESHVSIEVINFAREKNIVILTLPPHCSHKLQPLDVGVFYSFKVFIGYEHDKWLLNNPGKTITIYEIGEFLKNAYSESFTKENIESGFRATGIFPFDRNIFSEVDFLSSDVTDRPNMNATAENQELSLLQNQDDPAVPGPSSSVAGFVDLPPTVAGPSSVSASPSLSQMVSPEMVRPLPKAEPRKKKQCGRKPGRSRMLTDTPEKEAVEEAARVKLNKIKEKENKKKLREEKKRAKDVVIEMAKRKFFSQNKNTKTKRFTAESSSSDESDGEIQYQESDDSPYQVEEQENSNENIDTADRDFRKHDFVLVKFLTESKHEVYYIGQILDISDQNFNIKFLRRRGISNVFLYPNVDDIQDVCIDNITCKVKENISSVSKRMRNSFAFSIFNFYSKNIR
jgi:hypothetical protein